MNILMGGSRQYLSFFYRFEYLDDDFDLPARATIRDILSQVPSHVGFFFFSITAECGKCFVDRLTLCTE